MNIRITMKIRLGGN